MEKYATGGTISDKAIEEWFRSIEINHCQKIKYPEKELEKLKDICVEVKVNSEEIEESVNRLKKILKTREQKNVK